MQKRKRASVSEFAAYFGVSRPTMIAWRRQYELLFPYDPGDIYSVFDFFSYLLRQKRGECGEKG
jgi:hypothetical protein